MLKKCLLVVAGSGYPRRAWVVRYFVVGLVTMIVGVLLFGIVLVNAEEDVLLFDDFIGDGPLDISKTWEMTYGNAPGFNNGFVVNKPNHNWNSQKDFSQPISVEFSNVFLAELSRSDNNHLGLAAGGYADDMVSWCFDRQNRLLPLRALDKKQYWEEAIEYVIDLTKYPDITKGGSGAINLRIDWWPGQLVRYYLNDKLVTEYSEGVMSNPSPIGVRDETVSFRIGSIKVTRITQSVDKILEGITKDRKKAAEDREQMIAEYYKSKQESGSKVPPQVTDDPQNFEFNEGEYIEAESVDSIFESIGFVPDGKNKFFFIQLTDTHIMVGEGEGQDVNATTLGDTAKALANSLNEINSMVLKPAFIIITGDLTCYGKVEEFQRFKEIMSNLDPSIESFYVLGNHDDGSNFKKVFPDRQIDYSFDRGRWHFVSLFTHNNIIYKDQYFWLKNDLKKNKQKPTMIFNHHPMFMGWPNEDVRVIREKIFHLIKIYQNVKWMVSGHFHGNYLAQCRYNGIIPVNLVTTQQTFNSPKFHAPPGYRIICVTDDKVHATIYKKAGDNKFRVDPPADEFPVYFPPALDYYKYIKFLEND